MGIFMSINKEYDLDQSELLTFMYAHTRLMEIAQTNRSHALEIDAKLFGINGERSHNIRDFLLSLDLLVIQKPSLGSRYGAIDYVFKDSPNFSAVKRRLNVSPKSEESSDYLLRSASPGFKGYEGPKFRHEFKLGPTRG